jgi:hypothetical protein
MDGSVLLDRRVLTSRTTMTRTVEHLKPRGRRDSSYKHGSDAALASKVDESPSPPEPDSAGLSSTGPAMGDVVSERQRSRESDDGDSSYAER